MPLVTAEFLYAGLPDYWGGNGDRWDDDKGCLFAYYGDGTTVRDIVDGAVDDYLSGGDCDTLPDIGCDTIREALLACLTDDGRKDYHSGAVSEFAITYAEDNGFDTCMSCGAAIGDPHYSDCAIRAEFENAPEYEGCDERVLREDCNKDEYCDSTMVVFLIRAAVCDECGKLAEHVVDELCEACAKKHGYVDAEDKARFLLDYTCPCGEEWSMGNDCACNDRCPECNKEIEPTGWEGTSIGWKDIPIDR
jgi:hypothetical protein